MGTTRNARRSYRPALRAEVSLSSSAHTARREERKINNDCNNSYAKQASSSAAARGFDFRAAATARRAAAKGAPASSPPTPPAACSKWTPLSARPASAASLASLAKNAAGAAAVLAPSSRREPTRRVCVVAAPPCSAFVNTVGLTARIMWRRATHTSPRIVADNVARRSSVPVTAALTGAVASADKLLLQLLISKGLFGCAATV